jgi:hypothetical protein
VGGGFHTPNLDGSKGAVAPTPIRDKLSINPEEGLDVGDTPQAMHNYQRQVNMIHFPDQGHTTTVSVTKEAVTCTNFINIKYVAT